MIDQERIHVTAEPVVARLLADRIDHKTSAE
jgi:hypothetical protein